MGEKVDIMRTTGKPYNKKINQIGEKTSELIEEMFEGIADGIRVCGDEPVFNHGEFRNTIDYPLPDHKYAVIFSYGTRLLPENLKHKIQDYRFSILDHQRKNNGYTFCWDGGFFKSLGNQTYFRFGLHSPQANGEFLNKNSSDKRWKMFQKMFNVELKDWSLGGNNIIIATQPDFGSSLDDRTMLSCLSKWVPKINDLLTKNILIKPHPNTKVLQREQFLDFANRYDNITVIGAGESKRSQTESQPAAAPASILSTSLYEVLNDDTYAMITYNSSVATDSTIYGIPTFVFDSRCFAWEVCHHGLSELTNPRVFEREHWLYDLCNTIWSAKEMATGERWELYKKHISDLEQDL